VRRRLLNFLTVVSLLLCMAVVALWVRSRTRTDSSAPACYRSVAAGAAMP